MEKIVKLLKDMRSNTLYNYAVPDLNSSLLDVLK